MFYTCSPSQVRQAALQKLRSHKCVAHGCRIGQGVPDHGSIESQCAWAAGLKGTCMSSGRLAVEAKAALAVVMREVSRL